MDKSAAGAIPEYTIGQTARLLKISIPTLRMYEKERLILPFKKGSGQRLYSMEDIRRLSCIRSAINERKISIAAIRMMYAMIPCWAVKGCSETDRQSCPAYLGVEKPCWGYSHRDNVCSDAECRDCAVYQNYSECHTIKESIKEMTRKE